MCHTKSKLLAVAAVIVLLATSPAIAQNKRAPNKPRSIKEILTKLKDTSPLLRASEYARVRGELKTHFGSNSEIWLATDAALRVKLRGHQELLWTRIYGRWIATKPTKANRIRAARSFVVSLGEIAKTLGYPKQLMTELNKVPDMLKVAGIDVFQGLRPNDPLTKALQSLFAKAKAVADLADGAANHNLDAKTVYTFLTAGGASVNTPVATVVLHNIDSTARAFRNTAHALVQLANTLDGDPEAMRRLQESVKRVEDQIREDFLTPKPYVQALESVLTKINPLLGKLFHELMPHDLRDSETLGRRSYTGSFFRDRKRYRWTYEARVSGGSVSIAVVKVEKIRDKFVGIGGEIDWDGGQVKPTVTVHYGDGTHATGSGKVEMGDRVVIAVSAEFTHCGKTWFVNW